MCKQFTHKDFTNKEPILQTLPSFNLIAMVKLLMLMSRSSLAAFSGMLGTSSLSVPLKRRVPRRRKTETIRRKQIRILHFQTKTNWIKKREMQRIERNVRKVTGTTAVAMAMEAVMEVDTVMDSETALALEFARILQTSSIIISRLGRERDGQRGRIRGLIHKVLNLGVETVDVHLNQPHLTKVHHQILDLIKA